MVIVPTRTGCPFSWAFTISSTTAWNFSFFVLNAKYHELEAEIVAQAGIHGAVTIATNMAGRGTDIKLDDESKALGG